MGVAVGVGVALGVGVGVGTGVGVGVGDAATVMLSEDEKKKPVESQARITIACLPAGRERIALRDAFALLAFCTESIYIIIAVTVCSASRAAAENVTGEFTVAPLPGAQILTVLSTVEVHVCAEAVVAIPREEIRRAAARHERDKCIGDPHNNMQCLKMRVLHERGHAIQSELRRSSASAQTPMFCMIGEHLTMRGCLN